MMQDTRGDCSNWDAVEDLKRCKKLLLKCTGIVQAKDPPTIKLELSLKISKYSV